MPLARGLPVHVFLLSSNILYIHFCRYFSHSFSGVSAIKGIYCLSILCILSSFLRVDQRAAAIPSRLKSSMGILRNIVTIVALLSSAEAVVPAIPGFKLTWSDDFTGRRWLPPRRSEWITDVGTSYLGGPAAWGTGETQVYTSSVANVRQTGRGALEIVALKQGTRWTSGRIETVRKDFMARPGGAMRIQARMALPLVSQPAGYWPAFWTLGAAYRGNYTNWPSIGEFDILESVNGLNKAL